MRAGIALAAILATASAIAWMNTESRRDRLVWDHWDTVKRGRLYRSGQLKPHQLEAAIRVYGLKTVVSFLIPGPAVEAERAICRKLGVGFLNLPMPGDGRGQEPQFREVLKALEDPARRPVLVHCARGTCRTGASVALVRYEHDGWTFEDVEAEMSRQTYHGGILPGYVAAMVKERPNADLYQPQIVRDDPPTAAPQDPSHDD